MQNFEKKAITKKSDNFSVWYNNICLKAGLADYSKVKGCMVFKPYGFAIWKKMRNILEKKLVALGHEEVYFPTFIPLSLLQKEKEHVKGFSPELAVVTHAGGEKLAEALVVRPTSETIMYATYKDWIHSWRDLPLLYYTWNNVVRWEKRTYLFLRTTEFLWHEGHTVHATHEECLKEVMSILNLYQEFLKDYLAMPAIVGKKSKAEKFAGALDTYTLECLMSDKKCLQGGTSHDLGQNFSKAFDITFQDKNGQNQYVWQTCWAVSTRLIGGLIMTHSDNQGLVLPPKIAPIQVIVIPIYKDKKEEVLRKAQKIKKDLEAANVRVKIDDNENHSLGYKINEWELKGVPLRLEIGEREVMNRKIKAVKRIDNVGDCYLLETGLLLEVKKLLEEIQASLLSKAKNSLDNNTRQTNSYDEFKQIMKTEKGFIKAFWCGNQVCEQKIKQETKASTRCLELNANKEKGKCIYCHKPAFFQWLFAQAY